MASSPTLPSLTDCAESKSFKRPRSYQKTLSTISSMKINSNSSKSVKITSTLSHKWGSKIRLKNKLTKNDSKNTNHIFLVPNDFHSKVECNQIWEAVNFLIYFSV